MKPKADHLPADRRVRDVPRDNGLKHLKQCNLHRL
jgi:hypothetical protein